jgi:hypothetical protein
LRVKLCSRGHCAPPKAQSYPARLLYERSRLNSIGQQAFTIERSPNVVIFILSAFKFCMGQEICVISGMISN